MTINSIDTLYNNIVPFFESLPFQTRKKLDFSYWVLCVKLHKFGYYTLFEGKLLIIQVSNFINKNRYTNKKLVNRSPQGSIKTPDLKLIDQINSIPAPFDISTRLTHTQLAQEFSRKNGGRQGFKVHIYENCLEILNSPFSSYSKGHKAIGLRANSRIIARYIETGKIYKGKYTFTSSSLKQTKPNNLTTIASTKKSES